MATIQAVKGPIDTAQLGRTLMHEHVFVLSTEIQQNYPGPWGDEEQRVADTVDRLNELKAAGIDTIVDFTVVGLGRYIPHIQRVAAATGLNIVVATGPTPTTTTRTSSTSVGRTRSWAAPRRWSTCSRRTSRRASRGPA